MRRGGASNQSALLKVAQHSAQVACVHSEIFAQVRGGQLFPMSHFVEHASLSERERASINALVEDADAACVEPIEASDGRDALIEVKAGHRGL